MENFNIGQFFTQMESTESTFFLLCALISFLFGFLIAYLIRTASVRRWKQEAAAAEKRHQELEVELNTTKGKLTEANELREFAERERIELLDQVQQLKLDKDRAKAEREKLEREINELNRINLQYADQLNEQQIQLRAAEEQLAGDAADIADPAAEAETTAPPAPSLPAEGPEITTAQAGLSIQTEERLAALEQRLAQLERENQRLEDRLEQLDDSDEDAAADRTTPEATPPVSPTPVTEEAEEAIVVNPDKSVMDQRILTTDREADDLTRIQHISAFTQSQLYQIGVYTYEDIAGWDPARIAQVTSLIGYVPGRIEKDNWVGQAAALTRGESNSDDTQARGFDMSSAPTVDLADLKIIEGIGPKIEQVLKESGVQTLEQLAARDPEELRGMLVQAGDKYRMHDPTTWPKQAELAATGQLEELEEYQDHLKGGREPDEES